MKTLTTSKGGEAMNHTKESARFIFGQEMQPCPKCGSYNIGWQTPIVCDVTGQESIRELLAKFARTTKAGTTPLQGPVYLHCRDCLHKGPALDCSGRTREEIGQDRAVAAEVKRLWNEQ